MTNEGIRQQIAGRVSSSWATATPIAVLNRVFEPPNDSSWAQYNILFGQTMEGELMGVGIRIGVIMFEVNVPVGDGTRVLNILSDRAEAMFRYQDLNGVQTEEPHTETRGEVGGYYRAVTIIPFHTFVGE